MLTVLCRAALKSCGRDDEYFILSGFTAVYFQESILNTTESPLPDYSRFQSMLQQHAIEATPAEAQGVIAAVLCLPQAEQLDWLQLLLSTEPVATGSLDAELSSALLQLYQLTRTQLLDDSFEFSLFLPSGSGLIERTVAVSTWCRGFLLGISAGQLTAENSSDLLREILSDMVDISSVEPEVEGSEEDERALTEIEEYLKAAILLVREELALGSHSAASSQPDA